MYNTDYTIDVEKNNIIYIYMYIYGYTLHLFKVLHGKLFMMASDF